jgi:hypothetical protein
MIWVPIIFLAILILIFPKQVGTLVVGMIVFVGAFYLYGENQDELKQKRIDAVTIEVSYNAQSCGKEKPISVVVNNGSGQTFSAIRWQIEAYREGYTNNVLDFAAYRTFGAPYISNEIADSGKSYGTCYAVPALPESVNPESLIWKASNKHVTFKN